MIKFKSTLTDAAGFSGSYPGEIVRGEVKTSGVLWDAGRDGDAHTEVYDLEFEDGRKFSMSGDAYRRLDEHGLIPKFELLAALSPRSAEQVVSIIEESDTVFRGLVTTGDATLSCTVYSVSDDPDDMLSDAQECGDWELNEGNPISEVYFGGGADEDVEELMVPEFVDELLERAVATAKSQALTKALSLAQQIARFSKWGEIVDGKQFPENRNSDDLEDSHQTLMRLIDEARSITNIPM